MVQITEWFKDQVVFLTGGTGTLGGCILYKLAVQLPTAEIFVLCRRPVNEAIEIWETSMPMQVDEMLDTGKIRFVRGDMTKPNLGLKSTDLQRLRSQVTVVINAAADISLAKTLPQTIHINCVAYLSLIELLAEFTSLRRFLHISTAYVNSFLPNDSVVEERVYPLTNAGEDNDQGLDNPEVHLSSILSTGHSPHTHRFSSPYSLAKYLSEKLILTRPQRVPVLIVRPSLFAPAIRHPYPGYGSDGAIPLHSVIQMLIGSPDCSLFQLARAASHDTIVDEIPVDLIANTCLSHLALGTTGIVHAASDLYISRNTGESIALYQKYSPQSVVDKVRRANLKSNGGAQGLATEFFQLVLNFQGQWAFNCSRSLGLRELEGPLGLSLKGHDPEDFLRLRVEHVCRLIDERLNSGCS